MENLEATRIMRDAWAARRSSFDKPPDEKERLMTMARNDLQDAVALCREGTDRVQLGQALHLLANLERDLGLNAMALALWQESVSILRAADAPLQLAHKVRHLGDLHRRLGNLEEADACYEEAAALYARHDRPGSLDYANAMAPMATLKEQLGDLERASAIWRLTAELYAAVEANGLDTAPVVRECRERAEQLTRKP